MMFAVVVGTNITKKNSYSTKNFSYYRKECQKKKNLHAAVKVFLFLNSFSGRTSYIAVRWQRSRTHDKA